MSAPPQQRSRTVSDPKGLTPARTRGLHDAQVQGWIWQAVVLSAVVGLCWFLISNTLTNLQTRNIKTGFDFLGREAGFEIGETLITYSPAASYARALLVGFLNTAQVAVIGVVLATALGIVVGIGSLSRNWLLARITAGYIHFLRNVPVLLQIVLWYTILISERFLPGPRQAEPFLGIFATQRGLYFPVPQAHAGWTAAFVVLALGGIAYYAMTRWTARQREQTGKAPSLWLPGIGLLGAAPLLAWALNGAPTAIDWPALRGFNIAGGVRITPEFAAVLFGLTVYTSAFIGEIVRAGLLAVPKGQTEAARALGLKEGVILRKVVLPQAMRVIVPPLTSQYLNLTKNSSLSVAVGYPDLVNVANTTINQTGQAIEGIIVIMVVYLATSLVTSAFMNWYNKRIALVER
jgi:general L-amino acid transport system permease protein